MFFFTVLYLLALSLTNTKNKHFLLIILTNEESVKCLTKKPKKKHNNAPFPMRLTRFSSRSLNA